jgi:hypothetical protein
MPSDATERAAPTRRPILAHARHLTEDSCTLPQVTDAEQAKEAQARRLLADRSASPDSAGWSSLVAELSAIFGSLQAAYDAIDAERSRVGA